MKRSSTRLLVCSFVFSLLASCGGGGGGGNSSENKNSTVTPSGNTGSSSTPVPSAPVPILALWAGNAGGYGNLDGKGTEARFWYPGGVAVDSHGNLFVVDIVMNTIRKITPDGTVTTFAGTSGTSGYVDAMGLAAQFTFVKVAGITIDKNDNLYVADTGLGSVRKITPSGLVTTLAVVTLCNPSNDNIRTRCPGPGMAVDSSGMLYIVDTMHQQIKKVTPTGQVQSVWGGLCSASNSDTTKCVSTTLTGLAIDSADRIYVAENDMIRRLGPDGRMSIIAGHGTTSGDGPGPNVNLGNAYGLSFDANDNLYFLTGWQLRRVSKDGMVATIAGSIGGSYENIDGMGTQAHFNLPSGTAVDSSGTIYVADKDNETIRKVTPNGVVTTLAGAAAVIGSTDGVGLGARFNNIDGLVFDASGNLFATESTYNHTIRKITPAAVVTTLAGLAGSCGFQDGSGHHARFCEPEGISIDSKGNLIVADSRNKAIRTISPNGTATTVPQIRYLADGVTLGTDYFSLPVGVAVDSNDNIYVADAYADTIKKVDSKGITSDFAGGSQRYSSGWNGDGTGVDARFSFPHDVVIDKSGNLFVADTGNNTIRKITPAGAVTTIAGTAGKAGYADGTGAEALFNDPWA